MNEQLDSIVLGIAIKKLSEAFDEFVCECIDSDGKPKQPTYQAVMKARGYLPPYCDKALSKR